MQLNNIRVWLASRAEPAREPPSSRAEPSSSAREMAEPSRAELGQPPSCTEPALHGSDNAGHDCACLATVRGSCGRCGHQPRENDDKPQPPGELNGVTRFHADARAQTRKTFA
jgi:hypothetical protein